jgi:hypothetical protein
MTQRVHRFDRASLPKAVRLDSGTIRAPARLTRTGVFTYVTADGRTVRELRLPEEVFHKDSIASFELLPLTDNHHPEVDRGDVNARNVKGLAVGAVSNVRQDENDPQFMSGTVAVWDATTVGKVEAGKVELSNGYYCDREPAAPGSVYKDPITGDSVPYDFIQRKIVGNHVALVDVGRAGPQVKILLDGRDTPVIRLDNQGNQIPNTEKSTMEKITIDGVEFEVSAQVKQATLKALTTVQSKLDTANGTCDALKTQNADLQAKLDAATDPKAIETKINDRMEIERIATSHGLKADGLSMDGIKRAVILKLNPAAKLDGQSADYVSGVYSTLVAAKGQSVTTAIGAVVPATVRADASGNPSQTRAEAHRAAFFQTK